MVLEKDFLQTNIGFSGHEATDFQDNEIPKVDSSYTCLAVTLIDKSYYLQAFFKKCKNIEKGKKVTRHITDDFLF